LAKRKQIAGKYPGQAPPTAHLSDVAVASAPLQDGTECPVEYDMEDEYDDTAVSVSFTSIAFTSLASSIADMSDYWVVDSACSVNLTAFRSDFYEFNPSSRHSTVGGVGVSVKGIGFVRVPICLVSGQTDVRHVRALNTHGLSSRSAQKISRLQSVSWMPKHSGCELSFPTNSDNGMMLITT
jgi:hypothetical protein